MREQLEEGSRLFAFNLAGVDYIAKETVGTLVSIKKEITLHEGKLAIFAPRWDIKEYIDKFSFETDVPVFDEEYDALMSLDKKVAIAEASSGPAYVALGSSSAFKELFWTVKRLGGVMVERYEATDQAIDELSKRDVQVVLLDALMPRNAALDAVKQMRIAPNFRNSVILVIGPDSSRSMYNAMRDYGADDFVPVPFDREELVSSIDKPQFFELLKRKFSLWQEGYYERKRGM